MAALSIAQNDGINRQLIRAPLIGHALDISHQGLGVAHPLVAARSEVIALQKRVDLLNMTGHHLARRVI